MPVRHRFEEHSEVPLPDSQDLQSLENFLLYKHEAHPKSQTVFFFQNHTLNSYSLHIFHHPLTVLRIVPHNHQAYHTYNQIIPRHP